MGYDPKDCTEAKPVLRYPPNPNDTLGINPTTEK